MRMTASWSGSNDPTVYKSVTRRSVPNGELPSDRHRPDTEVREKAVSQFIIAPRAQASRRCETQALLEAASRQALLPFRSLDPFRSANLIASEGTKNGFPTPNKEPTTTPKTT